MAHPRARFHRSSTSHDGVPARAGKSGSKKSASIYLDHPFGACSELFAPLLISYPLHQGAVTYLHHAWNRLAACPAPGRNLGSSGAGTP
eukprot:6608256-Prymnesium_polylepis.1